MKPAPQFEYNAQVVAIDIVRHSLVTLRNLAPILALDLSYQVLIDKTEALLTQMKHVLQLHSSNASYEELNEQFKTQLEMGNQIAPIAKFWPTPPLLTWG